MDQTLTVGSIVRCRDREWVILPSQDPEIILLRPLTGSEQEVAGIYLPLTRLGLDRIEPAQFPLPTVDDLGDAVSAELLWNAARLTLRDGAGPFRSLGRVSVRPRAYQFVPLLMALRIDPIRLLIADDVGVGKTIEALLIARELLDRGEVQRLCVLCPPYLADQWKNELWEKFQLDAVVIRSGTINQLERDLPPGEHSIFGYYPYIVVSIDYAKSDRHRANFLQHCPDLVIVDEAHGAARPGGQARGQQQRHKLLCDLADKELQHLLLLTATPHSGIEESFLSLLGLLKPHFEDLDLVAIKDKDRDELARHFVQRRRIDVEKWLGEETPFPQRISIEDTYDLSPKYEELFTKVFEFGRELVRTGETLTGWRRRIRFWTTLSLLRCVMSSPAAAQAAITRRVVRKDDALDDVEQDDSAYAPYIYEPTDDEIIDVQPAHIIEEGEEQISQSERNRLRQFAKLSAIIQGTQHDYKVVRCTELVRQLLEDGKRPIIWCRYIATSDYVAEEITRRLGSDFPDLRVMSITSVLVEEERRERVKEMEEFPICVLVATDCLSEGINLQAHFNSVIHYDLPWNPNRLEQREGRVDRFGQTAETVDAILLYGRNNPVDGAVLKVLLRKAKDIRNSLGISVPIPMNSGTIMEAVLKTLFSEGATPDGQLPLFTDPLLEEFNIEWDRAEERERLSRTRFAQRAIKPAEVERELQETDSVLGDPKDVERFVLNALHRLDVSVNQGKNGTWIFDGLNTLPELVWTESKTQEDWHVAFSSPPPENSDYLGRNHPFVSALAQYLLEASLTKGNQAPATRAGVIRTNQVEFQTVLLMLRLRFQIEEPERATSLAEEIFIAGFQGYPPDDLSWIDDEDVLKLLSIVKPEANISPQERIQRLEKVLSWWPDLHTDLENIIEQRAQKLQDAHRRVRGSAGLSRRGVIVRSHFPPDLLGSFTLLPIPKGID